MALPDPGTGVSIWADTSQPPPDDETLSLLINGLRLAGFIVRMNDSAVWEPWFQAANRVGFVLHGYWDESLGTVAQFGGSTPEVVWLDYETGTPTADAIAAEIEQIGQLPFSPSGGIYTSEEYWTAIGNPQVGGLCELWVANWKTPVAFGVWVGGWTRARMVQYAGNVTVDSEGFQVDLSAREG